MSDNVTEIGTKAPAKRAAAKKAPAKRAQPHKPANVKQPTDRPKSAAQLEAEAADTITVEWSGMTFDINADADSWDFWTVTHPLAQGNAPVALIGLLGPVQAGKLRMNRPDLTNPEARELFNLINERIGLHNTGN